MHIFSRLGRFFNLDGSRVKGKILLREYLFEELEGAGIVGLAEPEHGLLPHFEIAVGLRDFD